VRSFDCEVFISVLSIMIICVLLLLPSWVFLMSCAFNKIDLLIKKNDVCMFIIIMRLFPYASRRGRGVHSFVSSLSI